MKDLDKTQKIIIIVIVAIILFVIGYYIMQKNNQYEVINTNDIVQNNTTNVGVDALGDPKNIIIHITGSVKKEGIIQIEENARIADVIEKAGGTLDVADLSKVNLAYIVQDGQKIYIPSIYDTNANQEIIENSSGKDVIIDDGGIHINSLVNINKATQTELELLTGIGPSTALKIIEYRKQHGNFKKIEDIMNVPRNRTI